MLFGAIRATHGFNLTTERFQGSMDPRVGFVCVIGSRLVFSELGKWVWHILIVVAHDITKSSREMPGGTWRTRGPRFTRRTLMKEQLGRRLEALWFCFTKLLLCSALVATVWHTNLSILKKGESRFLNRQS